MEVKVNRRLVSVNVIPHGHPAMQGIPEGCVVVCARLKEGELDHAMELLCKDDAKDVALTAAAALQEISDAHDAKLATCME